MARFVCLVPISMDGTPRKGASRTPALELPIKTDVFSSTQKNN